jgi:hypothetical protein
MVSTIVIAKELGIKHKKVKELMLKYNIRGVGAGLVDHERVSLVDRDDFYRKLESKSKSLRRGKKKPVDK